MGEDTNQIEREIRNSRMALGRDLDRLGDKAKDLVSWRSHYENEPRLFLGVAFGAGLAVGLAALAARQNVRDESGQGDEFDLIAGETYAGPVQPNTVSRVRHELGDAWAAIADGLVRTASAKAVQFLSERVPGFVDHVEGRYAPRVTPSAMPSLDPRGTHGETE